MMQSKAVTPFPTFGEVIRQIFLAFDIKFSNKELDEAALNKFADARLIGKLIKENINDNEVKYINLRMAKFLSVATQLVIDGYLKCVAIASVDGLTRQQVMPLLMKEVFPFFSCKLMRNLLDVIGGPSVNQLVSGDLKAVEVVVLWLEEHVEQWQPYLSGLDKLDKDKIASWKNGNNLPSLISINQLCGEPLSIEDWSQIKSLLMLARAIDYASQSSYGLMLKASTRDVAWSVKVDVTFEEDVFALQQQLHGKMEPVLHKIAQIQQGLKPSGRREIDQKETYHHLLKQVREFLHETNTFGLTGYWVDWHEARWNLYSGNLIEACDFYEKAFDGCLYSSGDGQKEMIFEALVVASNLLKPNKVFLKNLKNAAITFSYDLSSVFDATKKYKTSNIIEDWEVELWRSHFGRMFPDAAFFDSPIEMDRNAKAGPLLMTFDEMDAIKPDYRHVNRKIKVGSWGKIMPQIIWFIDQEKYDIVEQLIQEGANVNVFSESGDTPLVIALEVLNVAAFNSLRSIDRRYFDLISSQPHTKAIVNKCTAKKRLLPLLSAIDTGCPEIVKKVIDMGADVNIRGKSEDITPLNACIKRIGMIKDPGNFWKEMDRIEQTPEMLATLRRDTGGLLGITLEQQKACLNRWKEDPDHQKITELLTEAFMERTVEYMTLDNMRKIAKLLIDEGADPNAKHTVPLKGYTPFMLAVELDEAELVGLMLGKGGDPSKPYFCNKFQTSINSYQIANGFKSEKVMSVLP